MIYLLLSFTLGIFVVIMPILNSRYTTVIGTYKVSFNNYFYALITTIIISLVALYLQTESISQTLNELTTLYDVPLHYYIGGVLGAIIILLFNYFALHIQAFYIVILPLLGQMLMGFILDYIISQDFSPRKLLGFSIVCLGLVIYSGKTKLVNEKKAVTA